MEFVFAGMFFVIGVWCGYRIFKELRYMFTYDMDDNRPS